MKIPEKVFSLPVLKKIREVSDELNMPVYMVGGYVRDRLLKRLSKDVDFLVIGSGVDFATRLAEVMSLQDKLSVFRNFGTAHIKYRNYDLEFVGARKESYARESRKPVVEEGSLEEDLKRRDFSINALAISLNADDFGTMVDLFGGYVDMKLEVLRTPQDPQITFSDDPLRMMRAIRFASQLGFVLSEETYKAIVDNKDRISIISQERIADELNKIILSPIPSVGFRLLEETGLLHIVFPEMVQLKGVQTIDQKSHKDNFYHTLQVLDNLSKATDDLWLRWSAILHDIAKPATQRFDSEQGWTFHGHEVVGSRMVPNIFRRLKLPLNEKMKYVQKLVLLHLRPIALTHEVTDAAIRRLIVDAGDSLEDLIMLCRADITSKNPTKVNRYLQRFDDVWRKIQQVEEKDRLRNWKPPVTGEMIMEAFDIGPCRDVGIIKEYISEAILNGDIPNEIGPARDLMLKKGKSMGYIIPKNFRFD